MFDHFWYLKSTNDGNTNNNLDVGRGGGYKHISSTSSDEGVSTPASTSTATLYTVNTDQLASSVAFQHRSGLISPPEPTVLLAEIRQAVHDVAQAVERFGPKMAAKLSSPYIMNALFEDRKQLRLSSLDYIDSFTCQLTMAFKKSVSLSGEAPLLWWLWEPLFEFFTASGSSHGFTLHFAPSCNTYATLPYTIKIKLGPYSHKNGEKAIEMTAAYGGVFMEQRIFIAPIETFRFQKRDFDMITVPLAIDISPYTDNGNYNDMLDYLMPRPQSIWRRAMKVSEEVQKLVVTALTEACKAPDDFCCVTDDQDLQCRNLLRRLPPTARDNVKDKGLIGKEGGSFSIGANGPPGPKD